MENHITTQESPRSHFTMIPNIIDDLDLDPYSFRLYVHLRRVAGESGACWQSTATLAECCKMSAGAVSKAKQTLKDAGLIIVQETAGTNGYYHTITIVDVWQKNAAHFSDENAKHSYSEGKRSPGEGYRSPGETKKNPMKNIGIDANASIRASANDTASRPPGETVAFDTKQALKLQEKLVENARANGRRGPRKFPALETKRKFITAASDLDGDFDIALQKALEQGITSVKGVTNYLAAWARNKRKSNQPKVIVINQ